MNWWDKIRGGSLASFHGWHLAAMLGNAVDHLETLGREYLRFRHEQKIPQAFFAATFSVLGYLLKTSGRIAASETATVQQIMDRMQLNDEQRQAVLSLFYEGQQAEFPLQQVLENFRDECGDNRRLLQTFLDIQISTVFADGNLHSTEREQLHAIGKTLGLALFDIDYLIDLLLAEQFYANGGRGEYAPTTFRIPSPLSDSYAVLGVEEYADDAQVKSAYRRLMSVHHPDKLAARGMPAELVRSATEKAQEIQAAYDKIMRDRQSDRSAFSDSNQ